MAKARVDTSENTLSETADRLCGNRGSHTAMSRRELQAFIRYVDDRQPFMWLGRLMTVKSKPIGAGMYRVSMEVDHGD